MPKPKTPQKPGDPIDAFQLANSNSTANRFLGGGTKSWMQLPSQAGIKTKAANEKSFPRCRKVSFASKHRRASSAGQSAKTNQEPLATEGRHQRLVQPENVAEYEKRYPDNACADNDVVLLSPASTREPSPSAPISHVSPQKPASIVACEDPWPPNPNNVNSNPAKEASQSPYHSPHASGESPIPGTQLNSPGARNLTQAAEPVQTLTETQQIALENMDAGDTSFTSKRSRAPDGGDSLESNVSSKRACTTEGRTIDQCQVPLSAGGSQSLMDEYAVIIAQRIQDLNASAGSPSSLEALRYRNLLDACSSQDLFYIVQHQIFCLWSFQKPFEYRILSTLKPDTVDSACEILSRILRPNDGLSRQHLTWFAAFPQVAPDRTSQLRQARLGLVSKFMDALVKSWERLLQEVADRGSPLTTDELISTLCCPSEIMRQSLLAFTTSLTASSNGVDRAANNPNTASSKTRLIELDGSISSGSSREQGQIGQDSIQGLVGTYRSLTTETPQHTAQGFAHGSPAAVSPGFNTTQPGGFLTHLNPPHRPPRLAPRPALPSQVTLKDAQSASHEQQWQPSPLGYGPPVVPGAQMPRRSIPPPLQIGIAGAYLHQPAPTQGHTQVYTGPLAHPQTKENIATPGPARSPLTAAPLCTVDLSQPQPLSQGSGADVIQGPQLPPHPRSYGTIPPALSQQQRAAHVAQIIGNSTLYQQHFHGLSALSPQQAQAGAYPQPNQPSIQDRTSQGQAASIPRTPACAQAVSTGTGGNSPPRRELQTPRISGRRILESQIPVSHNDWTSVQVAAHLPHLRVLSSVPAKGTSGRHLQQAYGFLVPPTRLHPHNRVRTLQFSLTAADLKVAAFRAEGATGIPVRPYFEGSRQYRLRCCQVPERGLELTDSSWLMTDATWPAEMYVRVNQQRIDLARKQHFRHDLPAELTDLVIEGKNLVQISVPANNRNLKPGHTFFVAVEVVVITALRSAIHRISDSNHVSIQTVKADIAKRLRPAESDDIIIEDNTLNVSLADPFSSVMWEVPVRGGTCLHLECFDLRTWLNTRRDSRAFSRWGSELSVADNWQCPICGQDARPTSLRVCDFSVSVRAQLLAEGQQGIKKIKVAEDGSWTAIPEPA